jgi:MFS superfamily sulfate permease-like transporter
LSGFTNGIAILIAYTQIKDFFGLHTGAVPSEFFPRVKLLAANFASFNPSALALGLGTLAILVLLPRFTRRRRSLIAIGRRISTAADTCSCRVPILRTSCEG